MENNQNKRDGNLYDRIFKENSGSIFLTLIEQELDLEIKSFTPLPEKISKTVEREMDFFYRITTKDDKELLLHIEFQTQDDREMIYRMAEYHGLAFAKYKLPIQHVVIYLGTGKPKMKTKLLDKETFDGFDLINIHKLNTSLLLSSQIPEVIILSLLSDYETERTEAILRLIVTQLKAVCTSDKELDKYLRQLIILSRLRKLEDVTKKILRTMPIKYDIQQDALYLEGREEGREEGLELVAVRCLKQGKTLEEVALITGLPIKRIEALSKKLSE